MDKSGFLDLLNQKLNYLVDSEKEKEVKKYSSVIDSYTNMGQAETDAVSSLGNIDELVTAIYLSHGLDYKKIKGGSSINNTDKNPFKNFYSSLTSKDKKVSTGTLLSFVYLILILILIKVVFIFVRDLGLQIFTDFFSNVKFNKIYSFVFDILYIVCAIIVFFKLFIKKYSQK